MPEGGCNNKSCKVISPRVRKYTSDALICCDSEVSSRVVLLLLLLQATVLLLRQRKDKHAAFRNVVMNVFYFVFLGGGWAREEKLDVQLQSFRPTGFFVYYLFACAKTGLDASLQERCVPPVLAGIYAGWTYSVETPVLLIKTQDKDSDSPPSALIG